MKKYQFDSIESVKNFVALSDILPQAHPWSGAGVCITGKQPTNTTDKGFYPDPRYTVTQHYQELSWVFECLRDIFNAEKLLNSCSKFEFYGRLGNCANKFLAANPHTDAAQLSLAVLCEAEIIRQEILENRFEYLAAAPGNMIADDIKNK